MTVYKCEKCGRGFDACDAECESEYRGECFGFPSYEEEMRCPFCGSGNIAEGEECGVCGEVFFEGELYGGACQGCIDDRRFDFDFCEKIYQGYSKSITINALYACLFSPSEIENIIKNHIKSLDRFDCSKAIDGDKMWFGENLVEEVNDEN